jgi:hypothetical protein
LGNTPGVAASTSNLGLVSIELGDYNRAREFFQESLKISQELGLKQGIVDVYINLSAVACLQEDHSTELGLLQRALPLIQELGEKISMATCLEGIGGALAVLGYPTEGTRLLAAGQSLRDAIGAPLPARDRARYDNSMATVRALLGKEEFDRSWAEGRVMSMEQAIVSALEKH